MKRKIILLRNRILSILLMFSLIAAYFPASPLMAATSSATTGQFSVAQTADGKTVQPIGGAEGFGTKASAGRIWTNKDVEANKDGSSFDVSLSALAQEYLSTTSKEGVGEASADKMLEADVTFILDVSGSMVSNTDVDKDGTKYRRAEAMVMAANEAMGIVMAANPNNRVAVHWFSGDADKTHVGTLMEMGSYTLGVSAEPNSGYLLFDINKQNYYIKTNTKLLKDKAEYTPQQSKQVTGGTPTQDGIRYGVAKAISAVNGELRGTNEPKRKPYVFVLSDGAAGIGESAWEKMIKDTANTTTWSTDSSKYVNLGKETTPNTNLKNADSNTGSKEIAAATILTGMYMKKELQTVYNTYNRDTKVEPKFYTVGLGSNKAINGPYNNNTPVYAWAGLDPQGVYNYGVENKDYPYSGGKSAGDVYKQIKTYAADSKLAEYATDKLPAEKAFIYSDYYKFADNYAVLSEAFAKLSSDVEAATTILPLLNFPVGTVVLGGTSAVTDMDSAIAIVDEIGAGFELDPATLKIGSAIAKSYIDPKISSGKSYEFDEYKSKVVEKTIGGKTTLTWYIDAGDMGSHVYNFKDRSKPAYPDNDPATTNDGYAAPSKGAFELNYNLKPVLPKPAAEIETTYYANSGAAAYFSPPIDSPYYYGEGSYFISENAKTTPKNSGSVNNTTYSSQEILSKETVGSTEIDKMTMLLGNNGRLDLLMGIVKEGPAEAWKDGNIEYTVMVYNYTDTDISDLKIISEAGTEGNVRIPAGESKSFKFTQTGPFTGSKYTSTTATVEDKAGKTILTSNTVDTNLTDTLQYLIDAKLIGNYGTSTVTGGGGYPESTKVTLTASPAPGYKFVGWYAAEDAVSAIEPADPEKPLEIIVTVGTDPTKTYYAKFEPIIRTVQAVVVDSDGGDKGGTVTVGDSVAGKTAQNSVNDGGSVALTASADPGYLFVGWFADEDCANEAVSNSLEFTVSDIHGDVVTYYAKFELKTYTVTINVGQGGTATLGDNSPTESNQESSRNYKYGDNVKVTTDPDTKYTFKDFTVKNDQGEELTEGEDYTLSSDGKLEIKKLSGAVTIIVNFLAPGEITFNYAGGDPADESTRKVKVGDPLGDLPDPEREGYTFEGWKDSEGNTITEETTMPEKGITVYADWAPISYTVTLDHKGGTGNETSIVKKYNEKIDNSPSSNRTGYTFGDWYSDKDLTIKVAFPYTVTGNATWYAKWTPIPCIVTLVHNGGSGDPKIDTEYDAVITEPSSTRPGYTFGGWYSDPDLKNKVDFSYTAAGNTTWYAKWTPIQVIPATYTVTLHHNEGSGEQAIVKEKNEKIDSSPSSVREGYTFGGWYSDPDLKNAVDFPYTVTENADWYAKWTPVPVIPATYTVTLHHNGGSGEQTIVKEKDGKIEAAPPSVREGYTFGGWYSDPDLKNAVGFSCTVTGNTDWYAKWVKNENEGYIKTEISNPGTGTGDNDVIDKGDKYTLTVYDGNEPIREIEYTITDGDDANGKFTLIAKDLPDGDYTVVLKGPKPDPGQEITERVVIKNGKPDKDPLKMTLGGYIKNTKLKLKTPETPRVTVSGLNEIYDTDALTQDENQLITSDGSSTTITLFAEKVNDSNSAFAGPLGRLKILTVGQETALYLDLTLNKNISPADASQQVNEAMRDSVELLTISIPLPTVDSVKVTSYRVYREHDGVATKIGQTPNAYGEYCEPITEDGRAILHVRLFSLYAFTYTTAANGGSGKAGSTPGTSEPGTSESEPNTPDTSGSGTSGTSGTPDISGPSTPGTSGPGTPDTSGPGTPGTSGPGTSEPNASDLSGAAGSAGSAAGGANPKTGDRGPIMILAVLVISLGALLRLRKQRNAD